MCVFPYLLQSVGMAKGVLSPPRTTVLCSLYSFGSKIFKKEKLKQENLEMENLELENCNTIKEQWSSLLSHATTTVLCSLLSFDFKISRKKQLEQEKLEMEKLEQENCKKIQAQWISFLSPALTVVLCSLNSSIGFQNFQKGKVGKRKVRNGKVWVEKLQQNSNTRKFTFSNAPLFPWNIQFPKGKNNIRKRCL